MPRVSELERHDLPEELRPLWDRFAGGDGGFVNQLRVMAHSPDAFRHLYGLIEGWRSAGTLPRRLIEIAVVTVSRLNACAYCVGHHGATLIDLGLAPETVDGILDPEPPGLDERERLVRDYARLVTERAWGIREAVFERLRRHFSEREIVELTVRVGLCSLFNKLNMALGVEMEATAMADALAKRIDLARAAEPAEARGEA